VIPHNSRVDHLSSLEVCTLKRYIISCSLYLLCCTLVVVLAVTFVVHYLYRNYCTEDCMQMLVVIIIIISARVFCVVQHGEEIQTLQKRITHLETDLEQAKSQLTETNEKLEDANKNLSNVRIDIYNSSNHSTVSHIYTGRSTYASAVLGTVILFARPSVCPSVCPSDACFVTKRKSILPIF